MSIKKTRLKITFEQKQMWRVSQTGDTTSSDVWQIDKPALLKNVHGAEISPGEIQPQSRTLKILSVFVRFVNYTLSLLERIRK